MMVDTHWGIRSAVALGTLTFAFIATSPGAYEWLFLSPWVALIALSLGIGRVNALASSASKRENDSVARIIVTAIVLLILSVIAAAYITGRLLEGAFEGVSGPVGLAFFIYWAVHALALWSATVMIWNPKPLKPLVALKPEPYKDPWAFDPERY